MALRLLSLCLLGVVATSAAAEEPLVVEARAFEARLMAALRRGDRAALEPLVADGFVFVHSTGPVEWRDEYLAHAAGAGLMLQRSELTQSDEAWHVFGNTVIRYAKVTMRNQASGAQARSRNLNVYVKTATGWQWASSQSTKLPVRPRAAAVETRGFADYVGTWTIDAERSLVVTEEHGTLFAAVTGRSKAELVPTSTTTFLLFNEDNDLGALELAFVRDAGGKPVEAALRSSGQPVWRATRTRRLSKADFDAVNWTMYTPHPLTLREVIAKLGPPMRVSNGYSIWQAQEADGCWTYSISDGGQAALTKDAHRCR